MFDRRLHIGSSVAVRLCLFIVAGFTISRAIIATQIVSIGWREATADYLMAFLWGMIGDALVAVLVTAIALSIVQRHVATIVLRQSLLSKPPTLIP